jgi:hypothetical protein
VPKLRRFLVLSLAFALGACSFYGWWWPEFMHRLEPGESLSAHKVRIRESISIVEPDPRVAPDKRRWSGWWRGWACREQACDTALLVTRVTDETAHVVYLLASARWPETYEEARVAKFVGNELHFALAGRARLKYRFRGNDVIEMYWEVAPDNWIAGVLSRMER